MQKNVLETYSVKTVVYKLLNIRWNYVSDPRTDFQ